MARVLIIEDACEVAKLIQKGLVEEGFEVEIASSGEEALRRLDEHWNLIVLDLMLPDVSGELILQYLSQKLEHPSVLVLSAKGRTEDKLKLFDLGCDDYLVKPFVFEELLRRVRALLRRPPRTLPRVTQFADFKLDPENHTLSVGDSEVTLTPKEFSIFRKLANEPGRVISRKELLHSVWGLSIEPRTNFIEVHLTHLRKKLAQLQRESWLHTVRSSGVVLKNPDAAP